MVFSSQILGRGPIASSRHGLVLALFTGLTTLSALAGCGQKGSLYMPVPPIPLQTTPATAAPVSPPATLVTPAPALPAASAAR